MTFEAALEKLEQITEKIEDPETALDKSLTLYKEGISLAKTCGEVLTKYEAEVQLLQKDAEELFTLTPFFGATAGDNDD
ncbi:MAG: exodeoxyribonuclease VII small subunit [Defluviitaleaceae bacterium]|nr:exodeoxyribonuclease VII small subunit [Defluviitaleaceae bacterium]MCL2274324.1 exodeoxyribonuclease VII small subunit [Defluviitaleaceae bacterium]